MTKKKSPVGILVGKLLGFAAGTAAGWAVLHHGFAWTNNVAIPVAYLCAGYNSTLVRIEKKVKA